MLQPPAEPVVIASAVNDPVVDAPAVVSSVGGSGLNCIAGNDQAGSSGPEVAVSCGQESHPTTEQAFLVLKIQSFLVRLYLIVLLPGVITGWDKTWCKTSSKMLAINTSPV